MKQIARLKDDARKYEQREEWDKAIQAYSEVLRLGEGSDGAELDLPLYNRVGDLYVRLGRSAEAVKYYEQAADKYAEAGLYNNAIALCNKALRYDAGRVELLKKLGQFSASQGFFTDARRWYLEYCERMSKRGAMDQAFMALSELANVHDDPEIRELLARQLKDHGRPEQAISEYRRAYSLRLANGQTSEADAIRAEIHALDPNAQLEVPEAERRGPRATLDELPGFIDVEPESEIAIDGRVKTSTLDVGTVGIETAQTDVTSTPPAMDYGSIDLEAPMGATASDLQNFQPVDIGIEPSIEFKPPTPQAEEVEAEPTEVEPAEPTDAYGDVAVSLPGLDDELAAEAAEPLPGFDEEVEAEPEPLPLIEPEPKQPEPFSFDKPLEPVDEPPMPEPEGGWLTFSFDEPAPAAEPPKAPEHPVDDFAEWAASAPQAAPEISPEPAALEPEFEAEPEPEFEAEPVFEAEAEAEPEPIFEPEPLFEPESPVEEQPDYRNADFERGMGYYPPPGQQPYVAPSVQQIPEPEPEPAIEPEVEPEPDFVPEPETEYVPEPVAEFVPEPEAEFVPEAETVFEPEPEPVFEPEPEPVFPPEPEPVFQPEPEPFTAQAPPPAPAQAPRAEPRRSQPEYVDLASFLMDEEEPLESTRFVVAERAPTGDEERDFADMLKQFKAKVAETIPKEDAGSHYDLGLAFKEMGLIDEAIAEFQTALRGGQEKLKVYEELGSCFVQKQQYSVAITILSRAMQMPHNDESELLGVYYNLGRAHQELGQQAEARAAYERIISVDIGFQDTSERLAQL